MAAEIKSEIIPIAQVQVMAKTVSQSGLFGLKSSEQAMTLMLLAQSENIHPMTALQQYHIVNGRPVLKSQEVLARFQKAGGKIKYIASDDKKCEIEFSHEQAGSITIKWDIQKAKTAGIYDSNPVWKKYPENMLRSRCITDGVKAIYPSCLGGFMSESEAQDIPSNDDIEAVEVTEVVDVVEPDTVDNGAIDYKAELTLKLRKRGLTNGLIKDFATKYNLSEDVELMKELVENEDKLSELILKFEQE